MARWDPEAEERLRTAAIELFLEFGYDNVTVTQIADRAGLTRRTFSRYFTDKRDVLFAGSDELPVALAGALRQVPADVPPFEAVLTALTDVAPVLSTRVASLAAQRRDVIAGSPELQERGHMKFAVVADALTEALVERGVAQANAKLLADVGVAIFRSGFAQWSEDPRANDLADELRRAAATLTGAVRS